MRITGPRRIAQNTSLYLVCLLFVNLLWSAFAAAEHRFSAPHIELRLLTNTPQIQLNQVFSLGVYAKIEPGWHIYWVNPGDSGLPTKISWQAPATLEISAPQFPAPARLPYGSLVNYGYENEVLFQSTAKAAAQLSEPSQVKASVSWVLCKDECIPGRASLSLPLAPNGVFPTDVVAPQLFTVSQRPKQASIRLVGSSSKTEIIFHIEGLTPGIHSLTFVPSVPGLIKNSAPQKLLGHNATTAQLRIERPISSKDVPTELPGILYVERENGGALDEEALEVVATIQAEIPVKAVAPANEYALLFSLIGAFLGGLLLNLMPCVFPVLSLKVLELVRLGSSKTAKLHSCAFALGVVLSFATLAGILIMLKSMGNDLGWGFQFQSPQFVAVMALLVFVIGLNLSGVFDVGLALQALAGRVQTKDSYSGSFLSGVLATSLATPCTAPFMGSAVAYALSASVASSLFVFVTMGLGMAFPYLLFPWFPMAARIMPRPGAWMERFKQFLAFPMYATCVWLLWVLGLQSGITAVVAVTAGCVLLGFAGWILGVWGTFQTPRRGRNVARITALGLVMLGLLLPTRFLDARPAQALDSVSQKTSWLPYSESTFSQVKASGKAVLIDFTAAWCLVCQVNEQRIFGSDEVTDKLREKGVSLLRADWTVRDPEVTRALEKLGRSSVPLIVLVDRSGGTHHFESLVDPENFMSVLNRLA